MSVDLAIHLTRRSSGRGNRRAAELRKSDSVFSLVAVAIEESFSSV